MPRRPNNFGCKQCLNCEIIIVHKIKRDIERKKFCSKKCMGSYTVKYKLTDETRQKSIKAMNTPEANSKKSHKGSNHPFWIKDRSKVKYRPRYENDMWRIQVFKRDDYTCQMCYQKGGNLHADHIKPYSLYPEIRWNIDNGRTLCIDCHKKTDTYGAKFMWKVKRGEYNACGQ